MPTDRELRLPLLSSGETQPGQAREALGPFLSAGATDSLSFPTLPDGKALMEFLTLIFVCVKAAVSAPCNAVLLLTPRGSLLAWSSPGSNES